MRLLARRCAPLAVLCTGLGFVAVAVAPAASADTVTQYFGYTGGEQSFTVPGDVTSVHVVAVGGRGGDATRYGGGTDAGGSGAVVSADLQVTAGHTLSIEVGGNGETDQTDTAAGGFNGGATGGAGAVGAGGGGGASDVRTAPRADSGSLATRVLVAGGGGGAADGGGGGSSGVNGATSGSSGGDGSACPNPDASGGGGGGSGSGGTAGTNGSATTWNGQPGDVGTGGAGGTDATSGGGGGGGGWYGGGGGAGSLMCGAGGGGGSSHADPAVASGATYDTDTTGTPSITISYVVPHAPQAVTEPASAIGYNSVTFNGVVNPEGLPTTYRFDIRNTGATTWHTVTPEFPAGSDDTQVAVQWAYSGVVPGTSYDYRLVATNDLGSPDAGIQSFTTLGGPPAATTEPATAVGQTSAALNGVINPEGSATRYWFEYGFDTSYGSTTAEGDPLGASPGQYPVAVTATGLMSGTTYHFKLVAQNLSGTTTSDYDQVVTTLPASPAPSVTTKAATNVGQHGATLNGSVNPHGAATTYHFEYGTTTGYGHSTASVSVGSGTAAKAVHALLSGLTRHTTYHFRLVAVSVNGTTDGVDKTFRTT